MIRKHTSLESEDYDDDEIDEEKIRRKEKKKRKTAKTIFDIFDPHDLAMGHYIDQDHEIRNEDAAESLSPRYRKTDELDREAEWIYKHGFPKPTLTKQVNYLREDCDEWRGKTATVEKI